MMNDKAASPGQDVTRPSETQIEQIDKAATLEAAIRRELPLIQDEVVHHFSHAVYAREMRVPAGAVVVGKIHKYSSLNVLLEGEFIVTTDTGPRLVRAGEVLVAPPGTKRVGYAATYCRWLTVHGTEETDLDKIENHFIAQSAKEYLEFCDQQPLLEGK